LLEREPEPVGELGLAHSEHHPTHSDPPAYVFVDRIGCLLDCLFHDTPRITHAWPHGAGCAVGGGPSRGRQRNQLDAAAERDQFRGPPVA
jgi:hypothetical protein